MSSQIPSVAIFGRTPSGSIVHRLPRSTSVIGRGVGCDVILRDASVSQLHACIILRPGTTCPAIMDLESETGTWVASARLARGELRTISFSDWFRIGDVLCQLRRQRDLRTTVRRPCG